MWILALIGVIILFLILTRPRRIDRSFSGYNFDEEHQVMSEEDYREESWRNIQAQARASRDIEQEKLNMRWASITSEEQFNRIRAGKEDLPALSEEDEALFQ